MEAGYMLENCAIDRCANAAVAAQTDVVGDILDMSGYDGVMFVALLGDVDNTCALALKVEQGAAAALGDAAELASYSSFTAGAATADNKLLVTDIIRPNERYVRPVLERGTANAVVDGILAIRYRAKAQAVTQGSDIVASAKAARPAEA